MVLEELSVAELASRVAIRKSRVEKHLKGKTFGTLTLDELNRYAGVFNVPAANILLLLQTRPQAAALQPEKARINNEKENQ